LLVENWNAISHVSIFRDPPARSFVAALIVLAGAEFAARRGRDACAVEGP